MKTTTIFAVLSILAPSILFAQNCSLICNGDVDSVQETLTDGVLPSASTPCWHTTSPDDIIEVWHDGYNGIASYSGIQFLELNAFNPATLYQSMSVVPGSTLTIGFAHRGRGGIDSMSVSIGPEGGPYTTIGTFGDGQNEWTYRTVSYVLPTGTNPDQQIRFTSVYWGLGIPSVGNLLDAVTVCEQLVVSGQDCSLICNGDVDSVQETLTDGVLPSASTPCWHTTSPDDIIEVWHDGYNGIPSYSGIQFLELNAFDPATLYQSMSVVAGSTLTIDFAHRGRGGIDSMSVSIGPEGGPYTTLGIFGDGPDQWTYRSVNYAIPIGADPIQQIRFTSVYWGLGIPSVGNLLDAVSVCSTHDVSSYVGSIGHPASVNIWPDPMEESATLEIGDLASDHTVVLIYDDRGRQVRVIGPVSGGRVTIERGPLGSGVYAFRIVSVRGTQGGRFMVLN